MPYLDETPKYYVYAHLKPSGEIFYVGKGSGERLTLTSNRSEFWKRTAQKNGFSAIKLLENLTEKEAFEKEIELIAEYKAKGLCKVNISLGGDGVKVKKRWWNKAISKALKGRTGATGKESKSYKDFIPKNELFALYIEQELRTPEIAKMYGVSIATVATRLAEFGIPIRPAGRQPIKIRCLNDGKVFQSISAAAAYYKVFRENIKKVLQGKYKHTKKLRFIYEQE